MNAQGLKCLWCRDLHPYLHLRTLLCSKLLEAHPCCTGLRPLGNECSRDRCFSPQPLQLLWAPTGISSLLLHLTSIHGLHFCGQSQSQQANHNESITWFAQIKCPHITWPSISGVLLRLAGLFWNTAWVISLRQSLSKPDTYLWGISLTHAYQCCSFIAIQIKESAIALEHP